MSVRPSLYSYVNPKGDLYLKVTGGKPIEFSDKYRVIKSIDPNLQRKVGGGIVPKLFPHEASNRPPLSNVFQSREGSHLSEKEVPVKRTGIYWMKNGFVRKAQANVIEPNSVVQMKNQVLADGYPQQPGLIHQNKSSELQLEKVKMQIEKLQRLGENTKAQELMKQYFPNQVMIGELGQMISELRDLRGDIASLPIGGGGVLPVKPMERMDKAIEEKFNEILANRPNDIIDEMKRADQEIRDRIDALRTEGKPIPPELETFKKKLEKFDAGSFSKKFGKELNINPRKLSETNRDALENLARFLEGRSPTASPTDTPSGSRRGSTSGDGYPLMLQPSLDQSSLDDWKTLLNNIGNPKGVSALNSISEDDFKDVRKFAQNFLSKKEFDDVEKDYLAGKITKAQYIVAHISLGVENLKQYINKGSSGTSSTSGPNIQTIIQSNDTDAILKWIYRQPNKDIAFKKTIDIIDDLWKLEKNKDKNNTKSHLEKLVAVIVYKNGVNPTGEIFKKITSDKKWKSPWRYSDTIEPFINKNLRRILS